MEERGKVAEVFEYNFPDMLCKKHPSSSSVGICAYCLKERLVKLVCSECGEQRLSSCSCSDVSSSYRNSCSTMEIGSVGRISFLMENEKTEKRKEDKSEQVIFLRRSSSSCVEIKKNNGFWKIKRLFRKKRNKGCDKNGEFSDEKSEIWVSDIMGVSRSKSLCSFKGEESDYAFSSAKISDVTSGIFLDSESERPRKSGFSGADFKGVKRAGGQNLIDIDRNHISQNMSVFPAKESDFCAMDESAFIDLKLDLSSESKQEIPRISGASDHGFGLRRESSFEAEGSLPGLKNNGHCGSCRITVNEKGLNRGSKSHKIWKWIFKYHSTSKKDENNIYRT